MVEDRLSMVRRADHDRRVPVDKALAEKAGHGRKQTLVVSIELDGVMMVVNWVLLLHWVR
jgi:hypothetical protein